MSTFSSNVRLTLSDLSKGITALADEIEMSDRRVTELSNNLINEMNRRDSMRACMRRLAGEASAMSGGIERKRPRG